MLVSAALKFGARTITPELLPKILMLELSSREHSSGQWQIQAMEKWLQCQNH